MSEEVESRVLTKTIGNAFLTIAADGTHELLSEEGWTTTELTIGGGGSPDFLLLSNLGSWDLSGYSLQDKTLFIQSVLMQDMSMNYLSAQYMERVTIVSTTPITIESLSRFSDATTRWCPPGTNSNTFTLDNIIQGRYQFYFTPATGATSLVLMQDNYYGSGNSTAADRLYYCDAYMAQLSGDQVLSVPDVSFVIPSVVAEEPELEYLMRLSRSLEPVY